MQIANEVRGHTVILPRLAVGHSEEEKEYGYSLTANPLALTLFIIFSSLDLSRNFTVLFPPTYSSRALLHGTRTAMRKGTMKTNTGRSRTIVLGGAGLVGGRAICLSNPGEAKDLTNVLARGLNVFGRR